MSRTYSDPSRENDPYALPDVEVFYHEQGDGMEPVELDDDDAAESDMPTGWYYWFCFPGCLPDSDPMGPYDSEQEALEAARDE